MDLFKAIEELYEEKRRLDEVIARLMGVSDSVARDKTEKDRWTRLQVQFWHELGYDSVRLRCGLRCWLLLVAHGVSGSAAGAPRHGESPERRS